MSVSFNESTGVGYAGGYSGHGVVATNIAGRTLRDMVLNDQTPLTALPWVNHKSRLWEPEPLRWVVSNSIVQVLAAADRKEDQSDQPALRVSAIQAFLPPS
jgi:hypothetical protein